MFRTAELQRKLPKTDYHEQVPLLREDLLMTQMALREANFPVIVVFAGVDGAGKSETVNKLHEWLDSRWLVTHAFGEPSDEERDRPEYWRFWRDLPPRGRMGLFLSSWYSLPILDHVYGRSTLADFDERLERIKTFEQTLADGGALILKFWMHLSKDAQKERLRKLEKNPLLHWQISKRDWQHWELYDQFIAAAERPLSQHHRGQHHSRRDPFPPQRGPAAGQWRGGRVTDRQPGAAGCRAGRLAAGDHPVAAGYEQEPVPGGL